MWTGGGFGRQRGPLLDSEPVLFVNDHQAKVGELDTLTEERMGADDDAGLARCNLVQDVSSGGCWRRAGQQDYFGRVLASCEGAALGQVTKHRGDGLQVLAGEHLGGSQQGGLTASV